MGEVITIDGPSGAGKSTVSRMLAEKLGYCCLDTGAMYRAVALVAKRRGVALDDGNALEEICRSLPLRFEAGEGTARLLLGDEDISTLIRTHEFDMLSSKVSSVREVRDSMKSLQRKMSLYEDLVAEGRDMGTVVFPGAKTKFFLTASLGARALRRYTERKEKKERVEIGEVKEELRKRDHQDETRALAPLKPADDALIIDSTELNIQQVVEKMMQHLAKTNREDEGL